MAQIVTSDPIIYDLKHPFVYSKGAESGIEKTVAGIEFRRPKGAEADDVFDILWKLKSLVDGDKPPLGLSALVVTFVSKFGSVVGDREFPMASVAGGLDSSDILPLAGEILENFI